MPDNISIQIVPNTIVKTHVASKIEIRIMDMVLFTSVMLHVMVLSESNECIDSHNLSIEGDDYKKWSSDDNYIKIWVLNKLGFKLAA